MLFGSSKPKEKTVLILDIESGSVGAGLARISNKEAPKLFGERRIATAVPRTRDSALLMRSLEQAAARAIGEISEVASRLRMAGKESLGTINSAGLFLSAPWGVPDLSKGKPYFLESLSRVLRSLVAAHAGSVPVSFYTHAGALSRGMQALFDSPDPILVCSVHGEVAEFLLLQGGSVLGHATVPYGTHTLLRTLRTHGGMSEAEARSYLRLTTNQHEALSAAGGHFRELFREAGEPLFGGVAVGKVVLFARGPESSWFGRALSHESLADLFPEGGVVQLLRASHLTPYVSAHAHEPDNTLLLSALFLDTR